MNYLRDIFSKNKILLRDAVFHGGLLWGALSLAYNSYWQYMRGYAPLSREIKDSIKDVFPWSILFFVIIYGIYSISRKKDYYPSFRHYGAIFFFHVIAINLLTFHKGINIIIPVNLSLLYFIIFLLIWKKISPYCYTIFKNNKSQINVYFRENPPAAPFIITFMVLLVFCGIFLIIKQERTAGNLANVAYFLLVIGVGIEVYHTIKHDNQYTDGDE